MVQGAGLRGRFDSAVLGGSGFHVRASRGGSGSGSDQKHLRKDQLRRNLGIKRHCFFSFHYIRLHFLVLRYKLHESEIRSHFNMSIYHLNLI